MNEQVREYLMTRTQLNISVVLPPTADIYSTAYIIKPTFSPVRSRESRLQNRVDVTKFIYLNYPKAFQKFSYANQLGLIQTKIN